MTANRSESKGRKDWQFFKHTPANSHSYSVLPAAAGEIMVDGGRDETSSVLLGKSNLGISKLRLLR